MVYNEVKFTQQGSWRLHNFSQNIVDGEVETTILVIPTDDNSIEVWSVFGYVPVIYRRADIPSCGAVVSPPVISAIFRRALVTA